MLTKFPFLILALIGYNAIAFFSSLTWDMTVFQIAMVSGVVWRLSVGDIFLVACLFLLFIEIIKATHTGASALFDHALSTLLFVLCLVEFLLVARAATSTFFILTVIALIDVIAGFSITIRAARRDFAVGPDRY
ncbi:MAG TPA: hypothetical protein ENJ57_09105 [Rhizobiales bacterium]|nr:hypothetical protein [Hyphomicrobiales bacterium]